MSARPRPGLGSLRKRLSGKKLNVDMDASSSSQGSSSSSVNSGEKSPRTRRSYSERHTAPTTSPGPQGAKSPSTGVRRSHSIDNLPPASPNPPSLAQLSDNDDNNSTASSPNHRPGREGSRQNVFQRLRERSRSRSRSRAAAESSLDAAAHERKEMLVAVTSCRSDGYYNQKAPGSTSKLPRKAPTNLKLFHELAVGVKDAYAAVGAVPRKLTDDDKIKMPKQEYQARTCLWDFVGNLDFVSTIVKFVGKHAWSRDSSTNTELSRLAYELCNTSCWHLWTRFRWIPSREAH
jgi:hypothetical protein